MSSWYGVDGLSNGRVTKLQPVNKAMTGTPLAKLSQADAPEPEGQPAHGRHSQGVGGAAEARRETPVYYKLTVVNGAGGGSYKGGHVGKGQGLGRPLLPGHDVHLQALVRRQLEHVAFDSAVHEPQQAGDGRLHPRRLLAGGQERRGSVELDHGSGPAWTEPPVTEPAAP